jgi:hypothetical protein
MKQLKAIVYNLLKCRRVSSGMLRRVALVLTRATRRNIPEDTILHNHRRENLKSYIVFLYGEATHRNIRRLETLRIWFLQEPHGLTSQKTPFFIVTAVKTSNLTY